MRWYGTVHCLLSVSLFPFASCLLFTWSLVYFDLPDFSTVPLLTSSFEYLYFLLLVLFPPHTPNTFLAVFLTISNILSQSSGNIFLPLRACLQFSFFSFHHLIIGFIFTCYSSSWFHPTDCSLLPKKICSLQSHISFLMHFQHKIQSTCVHLPPPL